jgi:peptide deformylase
LPHFGSVDSDFKAGVPQVATADHPTGGGKLPMAVLSILKYPDPRLHKVAEPVRVFDDALRQVVRDMAETMYAAPGIGLAATQVDVHRRIIVVDVSEDKDQLRVLINPEVIEASAERKVHEEGCLSVPGIYDEVERPDRISLKAFDEWGRPFTLQADGLLAVCIQHEIDHLNGRVFVQYLSRLKQGRIRARLQKAERAPA